MLKGGHKKFLGSFYVVAYSFSHSDGGGAQKVSTLSKGGAQKVLPCLEGRGGGGANKFEPAIFPFCSPPLPVINDQSLICMPGTYKLKLKFYPVAFPPVVIIYTTNGRQLSCLYKISLHGTYINEPNYLKFIVNYNSYQ